MRCPWKHSADWMNPPMTKDAVAGRIRRLLALADNTARRTGIPDTTTALTPNTVTPNTLTRP